MKKIINKLNHNKSISLLLIALGLVILLPIGNLISVYLNKNDGLLIELIASLLSLTGALLYRFSKY